MSLVEQYVDSQVAVITLAGGRQGNLLNPESLEELAAAFERSLGNPEVRAVLLRSAGPAFCLGMDLFRLAEKAGAARSESGEADKGALGKARAAQEAERAVSRYADLLAVIFSAPIPVVCLVDGEVKAGGVGLVCACDIVVATPNASFELGEVLFGLIPANVLPFLLALRVPPQKARYLVLSSQKIPAAEALRLNLVDELIPEGRQETRLREIFKRLLRSSPQALKQAKAFTGELIGKSPQEAGVLARLKLLEILRDPGVAQAVKAFRDGDLPAWFSRFQPQRPLALDEAQAGQHKEGRP